MKKRLSAMVCVLVLLSMLTVFTVACNKDGFKINFYDGDSIVTSISTNGKEAITLPTDPVKAGYTFEGWFFDKEFTSQLLSTTYAKTKLKAEVNVYAKWTAFTYIINCDNEGAITTVKATYDKAFTCPAPTKTDYVFQGWYNGETQITDNLGASIVTLTGENGKVFNLTAKWALQTEGMEFSTDGTTLTKYTGTAKYVVIPDTVTSIGNNAFFECNGMTSITFGSGVTSIAERAFDRCSGLTSISVDKDNTKYYSADNCLVEDATDTLVLGCKNSIIPTDGSVTIIGAGAFAGCSELTSIAIPASVTSLEKLAFYGCSGLTKISIPDSVTIIGEYAFRDCIGLTSITLPNSVESIKDYAFDMCGGLTSITIGSGVKNIGELAFRNCTKLTSITIPANVTSIGKWAFYGFTELTTINCEAKSQPTGWDAGWKDGCKATVVWGYVAA